MRCPSCGSPASVDARFCDRCGAALGDDGTRSEALGGSSDPSAELPPPDGDRRVVTALFADLVDYVRLLAEHDPEEVRIRVTTALVAMAESIERLGGTREKFIGDAVFAVFGWPEAHDDDAVRAALAALSIRASLLEPGDGTEPLEVRIGIATGEVVTADRGPTGNGDLGLTGEAITTAARIQSLARPGEILVDGRTRDAARGRLALDGRGAVVLRGQSTPVELHALLGEAGLSAWTSHRAAAPGPHVGRERER
jgi:adenylate cyclase